LHRWGGGWDILANFSQFTPTPSSNFSLPQSSTVAKFKMMAQYENALHSTRTIKPCLQTFVVIIVLLGYLMALCPLLCAAAFLRMTHLVSS